MAATIRRALVLVVVIALAVDVLALAWLVHRTVAGNACLEAVQGRMIMCDGPPDGWLLFWAADVALILGLGLGSLRSGRVRSARGAA